MKTVLLEKMKESVASVFPITVIVLLLSATVVPLPTHLLLAFLLGAILLVFGMALFNLGTDQAMSPIGEHVSAAITRTKKLPIILLVCFLVGVIITISEPDLQVLAGQVPGIPSWAIICSVALGVGFFLALAVLRILFRIKLSLLLLICYAAVFVLAIFVPDSFLAIAFDSGGVTTGPMTVPFIMALGIGIASIRSDKDAGNDSFGLVALSSVGPILSVLILGILYGATDGVYEPAPLPEASTSQELYLLFLGGIPEYLKEVGLALLPILLFFGIFQLAVLHLRKQAMKRIGVGLVYTYVGLVLFLTGVNVGFMPVGNYIGQKIGELSYHWIIVPIGMLIGYFIVKAEPAVHVLNKNVEKTTSGMIPRKAMMLSLSVGVCISIGLAMLRVLLQFSILWLVIPGYALAFLLTLFVPDVFTAIAFDSGGVASGPMTATFLLPLSIGVCTAVGGNVTADAFGVVSMVAMTPLITIQLLGLLYRFKLKKAEKRKPVVPTETDIIDL